MRIPAFLALAAMLVACAPTQAPAPVATSAPSGGVAPQPTAVPKVEQKMVWGTNLMSPTLDPAASLTGGARRWDIFETLTVQDATGKNLSGQLAKDWKLVDDTTWEFNLVEGRKFQDGTPVTAEDVAWSYNRAVDPARKFTVITRINTIDTVTAASATKVIVKTKHPDPILPKRMASLAILPEKVVEKMGEDAYFKNPVGSGPFKLKEFVPDDHVTVVPWKDHPTRHAKLDQLTVKLVPDASQRVNGLLTGELDFVYGVPLNSYQKLKNEGFNVYVRTAGYSGSWGLDAIKDSPLKNLKVRLAMNYAIDKDVVSKIVYEGLAPVELGQVTQPEAFGFDPNLKPYPYDPATAKKLLAEAGYPNGFEVTADVWMASPEIEKTSLLLQQQLKDIGITLNIASYADVATFLAKGRGLQERAPMYNGAPAIIPQMDAEQALTPYLSTQPEAIRRMDSKEFDAALMAASSEMDPAKREKLLQQAAKILRDQVPVLFLVQQATLSAWSPKVKGFTFRIPDDPLQEDVYRAP